MFGLAIIDIVVIVLYFSWLIWIGYRSMKKINNEEDFFLGGRSFGKIIATFSMFGQATSGESGSSAATQVKQMGLAGIMVNLFPNFFQLPAYFFSSKWMRRLRLMTMASYYEERYESRKMAAVYAVAQAMFFIMVIALSFMAISKTIQAMTPKPDDKLTIEQLAEVNEYRALSVLESTSYAELSNDQRVTLTELREKKPKSMFSYLNRTALTIGLALFILIYAVGGGLEAAAKTDVIQSIFLLLMTVMLLPAGIMQINAMYSSSGVMGAFHTMHSVLPASVFELFGSPGSTMTWYLMAAMALALPNSLCQANQLVAAGAAKDDKTAREGFINGIVLKRFTAVIWGVIGMIILTIYLKDMGDPDLLWGKATRDLLGPLKVGLVGLMTACLMSGLMSSADTHMITVAALLTDCVYKPIVPNKSQAHYVLAGRIFSAVYLTGGVILGMMADDIWSFFKYMVAFNFPFSAAFLMGILWRRANRKAAWTSIIVSGCITLIIPVMAVMPGIGVQDRFLAETESFTVTKEYVATEFDVMERQKEISKWQEAEATGKAEGSCPAVLTLSEPYEREFHVAAKSIFWDKIETVETDVTNTDGTTAVTKTRYGKGLLHVEIVILHYLGVPLEKMKSAAVESLRFLMLFFFSFAPFFMVALLTKRHDKELLDQFYGKLRTPTNADHAIDAAEMELTRANPTRFDDQKFFKKTDWEFNRWDRYEQIGLVKIMVWVSLIYLLLFAVTRIGA